MSDLISRQDLKKKLNKICDTRCPYNEPTKAIGACCGFCFIDDVSEMIRQLPSAESVIYCKDCKWWGRVDKRRFYRGSDCLRDHLCSIVPDRDFCSRAERRTDE